LEQQGLNLGFVPTERQDGRGGTGIGEVERFQYLGYLSVAVVAAGKVFTPVENDIFLRIIGPEEGLDIGISNRDVYNRMAFFANGRFENGNLVQGLGDLFG